MLVAATVLSAGLSAVGGAVASATAAKTTKPTTKTKTTTSTAFAKYQACLKAHGVTVTLAPHKPGTGRPSGATGATGARHLPPGVNPTTFAKAQAACASLRPAFGGFNSQAFAAYRNCLKLNGVTLPTGPSGAGANRTALNASNPKVAAAMKACAALRPKAGTAASTTKS